MESIRIVIGKRRFTCLSPSLVRIEYSPTATFEDRRSMLAYEAQQPVAFTAQRRDGAWDVLTTPELEIRTRDNDLPCDRINLEIRWNDGRLLQFWRPDDRDHQNLGGTLRSLDRYNGVGAALDGVHPATMESFDVSGTSWPVWIFCEVDPLLSALHPNPPEHFNRRDWLQGGQRSHNDDRGVIERTFNWYKEARKFSPGILSHSGYCFLNDSTSAVLDADDFPIERTAPGAQDWYFLAYAQDYLKALRDFRLLSGAAPLPRHKSLGIMLSRWPAFTEPEIADMGPTFTSSGYPLSTVIMDMEWHQEGWGHWEFNPELIPDPKRFFALCRTHDLDVVFNDHPLDVREDDKHFPEYVAQAGPAVEIRTREYNGKHLRMAKVDITNKQQNQAFRRSCHTELIELGLDYWWNDGSRGQMSATCGQLVTNKVFFEESERDGRRGMLLARYGGLGSHRYGAFFTGDANSDYSVLRLECEFTIRAGAVGISSISHDIGGFGVPKELMTTNAAGVEIMEPVQYLRWLQFGVFNPILRFHSAPGCGSRKPYDYDALVDGACGYWLRVRHSLLPYIYTAMRNHHDTGIPLVRGMYLTDSANPSAYRWDQYFFGANLLIAPILSSAAERSVYLPAGDWWDFTNGLPLTGGREFTRQVAVHEVPVYVRAGGIIPRQSPDAPLHAAHVQELILDVYTGADGEAEFYEDDGATTGYQQGQYLKTSFTLRTVGTDLVLAGKVIAGAPLGRERTLIIRVHRSEPVTSAIAADGQQLLITDAGTHCQTITLQGVSSAAPWSVTMR